MYTEQHEPKDTEFNDSYSKTRSFFTSSGLDGKLCLQTGNRTGVSHSQATGNANANANANASSTANSNANSTASGTSSVMAAALASAKANAEQTAKLEATKTSVRNNIARPATYEPSRFDLNGIHQYEAILNRNPIGQLLLNLNIELNFTGSFLSQMKKTDFQLLNIYIMIVKMKIIYFAHKLISKIIKMNLHMRKLILINCHLILQYKRLHY